MDEQQNIDEYINEVTTMFNLTITRSKTREREMETLLEMMMMNGAHGEDRGGGLLLLLLIDGLKMWILCAAAMEAEERQGSAP